MPLWQLYHPEGAFDREAKRAISADITKMYSPTLPAFYVVVQFIPLPDDSFWIGGEQNRSGKPFVRVVINHVAVTGGNEVTDLEPWYRGICDGIDKVLNPYMEAGGFDWEYHVGETDRRLWKINGLIPPPWKSDEEREWARVNKAMPWAGDH